MEKVLIAKILKPQALKGQVKVKPYGNDLDLFKTGLILFTKNSQLEIEKVRNHKGFLFIDFVDIDHIDKASKLRSLELYISSENIAETEADEWFIKDLLNLQVFNNSDELLGKITAIENYGGADVYTIKHKGKTTEFAFIEGLFESVDIKNKKIVVNAELFGEVSV
jgi:16S rRNA processing protein RimM